MCKSKNLIVKVFWNNVKSYEVMIDFKSGKLNWPISWITVILESCFIVSLLLCFGANGISQFSIRDPDTNLNLVRFDFSEFFRKSCFLT